MQKNHVYVYSHNLYAAFKPSLFSFVLQNLDQKPCLRVTWRKVTPSLSSSGALLTGSTVGSRGSGSAYISAARGNILVYRRVADNAGTDIKYCSDHEHVNVSLISSQKEKTLPPSREHRPRAALSWNCVAELTRNAIPLLTGKLSSGFSLVSNKLFSEHQDL